MGTNLRIFLVLVFLSGLLLFLDAREIFGPAKSIAQVVTAPIQLVLYRAKLRLGDALSFLTFWKSGEARIRNLELRNLELIAVKNRAEDLERENEVLRKQLGIDRNWGIDRNLLPAPVLGRGEYLEIGQFAPVGSSVIFVDNLVGRVVRSGRTSFVQLPTDSQAKIPVFVGRVSGLVYGQFNSSIVLDHVEAGEEINIGDLVTTSGEGGNYEPNLIIGKIKRITSVQTDVFQKAEIEPLINYNKLVTVFVVLPL